MRGCQTFLFSQVLIPLLFNHQLYQPVNQSGHSIIMSDLKATVAETKNGFHVEGYEKIEYDFTFLDGVFNTGNSNLADCYKKWGRCLAVMDMNIFSVYGEEMQKYFDHYNIELDVHKTMIGEKAKSIDTFLSIVDSMNKFGIYRKVRLMLRKFLSGKAGANGSRNRCWLLVVDL